MGNRVVKKLLVTSENIYLIMLVLKQIAIMEEALIRFPHIGDQILQQLNNEDYTNCRGISETFKSFIDNQKLLHVRIIEKYINSTDDWQTFVKISGVEEIIEMAQAIKNFSQDKESLYYHKFAQPYLSEDRLGYLCTSDNKTQSINQIKPMEHLTVLQCATMFGNCKTLKKWHKKWLERREHSPSEMHHQYKGRHLLEYAATYDQLEAYILIADNCQDKNPKDSAGVTPLHHAALKGHYDICQWILNNIKLPKYNFFGTYFDESPLECAAANGHVAICQLIMHEIKDDAPNDLPNLAYEKALSAAADNGQIEVFQSIIGEIKKMKKFEHLIHNCHELSALYLAAFDGKLKICRFLIENWDVNYPIEKTRAELIYQVASEKGHEYICEYLKSNANFSRMLSSKRQRKK